MRRITSALYLDFDNIFSGLLAVDEPAALALAKHAETLIECLEHLKRPDEPTDTKRDVLIRRAYLNPDGRAPGIASAKTAPSRPYAGYRNALVEAGFEVIDCPALTQTMKNAADIRIVIDVLDALNGPVRYDEVIVASGDSDFRPLLVRLRAADRRTMIVNAGTLSKAYRAVADHVVDRTELVRLLGGTIAPTPTKASPAPEAPKTPAAPTDSKPAKAAKAASTVAPAQSGTSLSEAAKEEEALRIITTELTRLKGTAPLNTLGQKVRNEVHAEGLKRGKWFGHPTLTKFLNARRNDWEVSGNQVRFAVDHLSPPATASK